MKFSNKILSQTITQLCLNYEVNNIVISPGSRNAPLTIGFTENHSFKNYSIVDERCAAFFALGLAQQLKEPVALVCSSGSALLNYFPAIAEAFYSDIPLIVISADRPEHLLEIGDGQTIQQENVFGNHILYNANCKEGDSFQRDNEIEINRALRIAKNQKGPVHINVPFSEPLYETVDKLQVDVSNYSEEKVEPLKEDLSEYFPIWEKAKKKLVLVGVLTPNSIQQKIIDALIEDESVIVFTETTSNLHHNDCISAIDQLIAPLEEHDFETIQPDLLLTFGGMVISKKVKSFLRNYSPKHHWHVDDKKAYDTYFALSNHVKMSPSTFLEDILSNTYKLKSDYKNTLLAIKEYRLKRHKKYLEIIPFSDFKAFSTIFKNIPSNFQLQLSNSATVRYAQLFNLESSLQVFCNRGTSGIDGSTSTAIGAAIASDLPTVFITGDLSFLYDSNALWNSYIPKNFKIIVINNGGGGIFRILPGEKNTEKFDTYFETKHSHKAKNLCEMYGINYNSTSNVKDLEERISIFFQNNDQPQLLEIFTPSKKNDQVLLDYFKFIK
ncbi:MAG: 2-succinyl-5-enolpyruvyl-6-hydroxy-3-cyclohexene-1-carboxylic-acid synthase [Flavobacteriaceae bacterium]|nr:2-succinyl-5-enolpyruvyl-6-hydroxy-3-cyclohexene-1-carboxylic-acid synthase [Flavobacteriaceae bacterium]